MSASRRRQNHRVPDDRKPSPPSSRWAWLSPPIGAAVIVALAAAASLAQATPEIFVAASLVFSLCEAVVLALVGYAWSRRGLVAATLAGIGTAAVAAPARWEVTLLRYGLPLQQRDLLEDLLVSIALGALAGLAGATILRSRFAAMTAWRD